MNTEADALEPFEFKSVLYKRFLWTALLSVLLIDAMSIPTIWENRFEMSLIGLVLLLFGITMRVGLLIVLLVKKGPIDVFVYVWGGLFIIGGFLGLLSLVLSSLASSLEASLEASVPSADPAPLIAYLEYGVHLSLGLLLVVPFRKCVTKVEK